MAKRKREIDFIAAQKLMGKTGQATSFEFILVITVVVVAAAMIGWFMFANSNYNETVEKYNTAKSDLKDKEDNIKKYKKQFSEYAIAKDEYGNDVILSVNSDGTVTYKWLSINEVASSIANKLAAAQSTTEEIKNTIDLTTSILNIVFYGADLYECNVESFSYSTTRVTVNYNTLNPDNKITLLKVMKGAIPSGAINPTKFISGATIGNETVIPATEDTPAIYKFTISFIVTSDVLEKQEG